MNLFTCSGDSAKGLNPMGLCAEVEPRRGDGTGEGDFDGGD